MQSRTKWFWFIGYIVGAHIIFLISRLLFSYFSTSKIIQFLADPINAIYISFILNFLDWLSTKLCIQYLGIDYEINLIAKLTMHNNLMQIIFKFVIGSGILVLVCVFGDSEARLALNMFLFLVVSSNMCLYARIRMRIACRSI